MIMSQFHQCDCHICEWLNFGTLFKFPFILQINTCCFVHHRNHPSDSHVKMTLQCIFTLWLCNKMGLSFNFPLKIEEPVHQWPAQWGFGHLQQWSLSIINGSHITENGEALLTHWGWDRMATIFQMTFSNAFSWMKIFKFWLRFHWSLFPRVQLTIFQHWFR